MRSASVTVAVPSASACFERGDVVEAAEPARDVARRQRLAFERGDDADDVDLARGRDHDDAQLSGVSPNDSGLSVSDVVTAATRSGDTGRP